MRLVNTFRSLCLVLRTRLLHSTIKFSFVSSFLLQKRFHIIIQSNVPKMLNVILNGCFSIIQIIIDSL
ncbi:hypothetical protein HanIR_Chr10g0454131 [Helianthus annuus]|nr:hypothetical protein HanIR_Chr10g0454131 [Helianthus annuus]